MDVLVRRSLDIASSTTRSEAANTPHAVRKGWSTPVLVIGCSVKSPAIPVLCYAKILSGPDFVSFSRDRDKGLSKRQATCETQSRCSRCRSGLGLRFLSLLMLLTTVFGF